ncbi:MAG: DNA primase, partial [Planctomycetes bacterium]|nr:DNA primase [Planctomycetota bacterium]
IVDVISGYVSLQKAGRNFKAVCPFHTEKTPSFIVNPERQSWHCFGACSTGGDAFTFVMRKEGLGFGETLRLLAEKTGVTLKERRDEDRTDVLFKVNQEAARFYQDVLASEEGRTGREYLAGRGVDAPTSEAFQIGLSPQGRDRLKSHLSSLGFNLDHAVAAGLLHLGEDGSLRDFFWGRLMFPIHDRRGRIAGFGARTLDGSNPKYINTPGTRVFNKRETLYGLHKAATPIREADTAVIVEGYMDAMAAHQYGYKNVVASMGTALTERQVAQLRSIATNYVLALDPDTAGQEATLRSLESSWRVFERQRVGGRQRSVGPLYQGAQLKLKITALPPGRDPDQVIREDPKEWERLVEEAVPFMEFLIPALASKYDLSDPQGKAQAAQALGPLVVSTGDAVEQEHYFRLLARVLDVSVEALEASIGKPRPGRPATLQAPRRPDPAPQTSVSPLLDDRRDLLEEYLLALLLQRAELKERAGALAREHFRRAENREVFTQWHGCSTIEEIRAALDDSLHDHLDHLVEMELSPSDPWPVEDAFDECLRRLEQAEVGGGPRTWPVGRRDRAGGNPATQRRPDHRRYR